MMLRDFPGLEVSIGGSTLSTLAASIWRLNNRVGLKPCRVRESQLCRLLLAVEENRIYLAALSRRRIGHAAPQINAAIVATWPDTSG